MNTIIIVPEALPAPLTARSWTTEMGPSTLGLHLSFLR
jgi:hypothetical protein